jgi:hypothetical protein
VIFAGLLFNRTAPAIFEANPRGNKVTKNSKTVAIAAIAAAIVLMLALIARDLVLRHQKVVACSDGSHPTIDVRDFTTQYWAYSAKLEASVKDKVKVSAQLDPKELQEVSLGLQEAREFREYVVAGYNSCAITQTQYARFGSQFLTLDALAQEINSLLPKSSLSFDEGTRLAVLIREFGDLAKQLGSQ